MTNDPSESRLLEDLTDLTAVNEPHPFYPNGLGRSDYTVNPTEYLGKTVRFIRVPQLSKVDLSVTQAAVLGIICDKAHEDGAGGFVITKNEYATIIDKTDAACVDLKGWSRSTRSLFLTAFKACNLVSVSAKNLVFRMTREWWKLPFAVLTMTRLTITRKVEWAALVHLSHVKNAHGFMPLMYEWAMELGRKKSKVSGKIPKRFTSDAIARMVSVNMVGIIGERKYLKTLAEISFNHSQIITGDRPTARNQWENPCFMARKWTVRERRDEILRSCSPRYRELSKQIYDLDHGFSGSRENLVKLTSLRHACHILVNEMFDALALLLPFVQDASDWVVLGIDAKSYIALKDEPPRLIHYERRYSDCKKAAFFNAGIEKSVEDARSDILFLLTMKQW